MADVGQSLWITVVGMGLVFGALALFWGLISVLVRVTREEGDTGEEGLRPLLRGKGRKHPRRENEAELRQRAAVAAVAVALARREVAGIEAQVPGPFPVPPQALVSTWQAVMRARQLGQRRTIR